MKKYRLLSMCVPAIFVLAFALTGYASYITSAGSDFKRVTSSYDGYEYKAATFVHVQPVEPDGGSYVGSEVIVSASDYDDVPAGYMGGEPRLYLDDKLLFAEGWSYNNGEGNAFGTYYDTYFVSRGGIVYSKSKFGIYNGDGYDVYDTYRSPSLDVSKVYPDRRSVSVVEELSLEFGVNDNGQTYGSGLLSTTPDLIAAIGVGGVHGYVSDEELTRVGLKSHPEDSTLYSPKTIPLYDKDGQTVIGEFAIGFPQ